MGLFALGLLLPLQSYFIAQSSMFTQLEITDTRLALIIPYTAMGLPLAVYLLKVYLDALPEELFEAARIDGAGDRPGLPRARAAAAAAGSRDGGDLLRARLPGTSSCWRCCTSRTTTLKTIPTGLLAFSSRYVTDYSLLFSALSIVTIPMIVIYVVFNRQIVEGITAGSVK